MRKTFYFPTHIKERLLKFRKRHEMMDEQVAIIRLLEAGLTAEENKEIEENKDKFEIERKGMTEGIRGSVFNPWATFFRI